MKKYILPIGALFVVVILGTWLILNQNKEEQAVVSAERQLQCERHLTVAIFASGEDADNFMRACLKGEPVLPGEDGQDSLPPPSSEPNTPDNSAVSRVGEGCMLGGCSNQICGEEGSLDGLVTTCEYRSEYACYSLTRCEKQSTGKCGWTETEEYNQCLSAAKDETPVVY